MSISRCAQRELVRRVGDERKCIEQALQGRRDDKNASSLLGRRRGVVLRGPVMLGLFGGHCPWLEDVFMLAGNVDGSRTNFCRLNIPL